MLPQSIRRLGTALVWIGVGLIVIGAVLPALAPSAVAGAASNSAPTTRSVSQDSVTADQVLRDEAAAVKRRVEEFRERSRAEDASDAASRVCYWAGAVLIIGGLIGRLTSGRRRPDVETH